MQGVHYSTHSGYDIHCKVVPESLNIGGGVGAQTKQVGEEQERVECCYPQDPLSLAVHNQDVVEHDEGDQHVAEQIEPLQRVEAVQTDIYRRNGAKGLNEPHAKDVQLQQCPVRSLTCPVAHEGVVGDTESEGQSA